MGGDKLDQLKIQLMKGMHAEGYNCREIAKKFGVGHSTAWFYVSERTAGFKTYKEYQNFLAREQGFDSYEHYRKVARGEARTETTEDKKRFVRKRGFESYNDLLDDWARRHGEESYTHYQQACVKNKGRPSYLNRKKQQKFRQESPKNKRMSAFIKRRLKDWGKTQQWLAIQLEVTKQAISNIVLGKNTVGESNLDRFCEIMNISHRTLEGILNN